MKAYKYRGGEGLFDENGESTFNRDLKTLSENKIYAPCKDKLNDPTENLVNDEPLRVFLSVVKSLHSDTVTLVEDRYKNFCDKIRDTGVFSLSKSYSNELLWAYYGGGHTGFCIEYDIDTLIDSVNYNRYFKLAHQFDITYADNIPNVSGDNIIALLKDSDGIVKTYIGTKSKAWKHEDEYRLVFDKSGIVEIDYRAVTGIYFGCKMQDKEMDHIMRTLQGRKIEYYKMEFDNKGYRLKRTPINDTYSDAPEYIANNVECEDWFLSEDFMGDTYKYKDKLLEALEIVKRQPLITKIYQAVVTDDIPPVFKVFAYTGRIPPVREFKFTLNNEGELTRGKV